MTDSLPIGETHVNALSVAIATNGSLAENAVTNCTIADNATASTGSWDLGLHSLNLARQRFFIYYRSFTIAEAID